MGVDPFLPASRTTSTGVQLQRRALENVEETFDVLTMVHTLEHIPNQQDTMHAIHRVLAPNGVCLISIPVSGGQAWHQYRANWVQLDPPRHLILHTPESLEIVARAADLEVRRVIWDSTSFQFWGSELVGKNKPILPLWRSWLRAAWRIPADCVRAARVNSTGHGNQATFVLARKQS